MEPWSDWLRPELIWFFVGLILLFAEMVIPGLIVAFFAFGAWVVAAVQLCKPLTLNQQLALFIASSVLSLALARSWLKSMFTGYVSSRSDGSIDLGEFILMGRGEEHSGGRERPSILANTLEAVIGAVFLDQGLKSSRKFVLALIKDEIEIVNNPSSMRDPKTALQEYVQKKYKARPIYEVIDERGPDHRKEFTVRLLVNGREIVTGEGPSKRKAEMNAARISLQKIEDGTLDV